MLADRLSNQKLAELRPAPNVRETYRISVVILLAQGRTGADVADALLIDPQTVGTYFNRYKKGGVEELLRMNYVGSEALLDTVQMAELDAHLKEYLYLTAESVARWVKERWRVCCARSGMAAYTRGTKLVPVKATTAAQEEFRLSYAWYG
jgi:transposase